MKKTVKTIVKLLGSALCALLFAVNAVPGMDMVLELPDDIYVDEAGGAERLCGIPAPFSITDRDGVAVANDLSERLSSAKNGEVKRFSVELFGITVKKCGCACARRYICYAVRLIRGHKLVVQRGAGGWPWQCGRRTSAQMPCA